MIANGVMSIGDSAFKGCSGLTSVTIPGSVTTIEDSAFEDCRRLMTVVIPSSVWRIGRRAFYGCRELKLVRFYGDAPRDCDTDAFRDVADGCEAVVPRDSTGWGVAEGGLWNGLVLRYARNATWTIGSGVLTGVELNDETDVTIPSDVEEIGPSAFAGCSVLTSVTIPSGVTRIEPSAFVDCSRLTSFVVAKGNRIFSSRNGLLLSKDERTLVRGVNGCVTIPDSVTRIGVLAFDGCSALASVSIPSSVWSFGSSAFRGCTAIRDVEWNCALDGWTMREVFPDSYASLTNVTLGAGVTRIGDWAFDGCSALASVSIPSSVWSFGSSAFRGCTAIRNVEWNCALDRWTMREVFPDSYASLTNVTLGAGVTRIGSSAFRGCTAIQDVVLECLPIDFYSYSYPYRIEPEPMRNLFPDSYAKITKVTLGTGVTALPTGFFAGCDALVNVTLSPALKNFGVNDLRGIGEKMGKRGLWIENGWVLGYIGTAPAAVVIPEDVTGIAAYAFKEQTALSSVTIPSGVTGIGAYAFRDCRALTSVTIPSSVTYIGNFAFDGCTSVRDVVLDYARVLDFRSNVTMRGLFGTSRANVTNVTLGAGVTALPDGFFDGCEALANVTFPPTLTDFGNNDLRGLGERMGKSGLWIENGWILGYVGTAPAAVAIPEDVTGIAAYAFKEQTALSSVAIPLGVTEIGTAAFSKCENLDTATLSRGIGALTVGANAFDRTAAVAVEPNAGSYFGGWTNANGVILSSPFHSPERVTVAPRWMDEGAEYDEHLIFFEDFERASMEFVLTTVGTFPNPARVQNGKGVDGSRGFGFGRSSCQTNALSDYVNTLTASFAERYFITRVVFDEMERYGNWGSDGSIVVNRGDGETSTGRCFGREPLNDNVADTEYRHRDIEINRMATNISLQVSDITDASEVLVDNVRIYGRLARRYAVAFDGNGGAGAMDAQTVIEGDSLAPNAFVRAGYRFLGWGVAAGGDVLYAEGATIRDIPADGDCTTLYAVWKPQAPDVVPAEDRSFVHASETVSLSHDADDVKVFYTTDGSDPVEQGHEYTHDIAVYRSCTIRAVAYGAGRYSEEVVVTLTRADGLGEAANLYGYLMESGDADPWTAVADASHDGVSCVRSGAIGNGGVTWLQTSVRKAGTVSFWWRAMCEEPDAEEGEDGYYDYGVFIVDGNEAARLAGNDTGWQFFTTNILSGGKHVLRWEYRKDGATSYAPDCLWLDQVRWIPADGSGCTLSTPEPVPYAWLSGYGLGGDSDFETVANAPSGKTQGGRATSIWEEYVAGTDPTNAASRFTAKIEMRDGRPIVTWEPDLNTNGMVRLYKVYGSETLENGGDWQYPTNSLHKFFKVEVGMP